MTAVLEGPFIEYYHLIVDGYVVPHVKAHKVNENEYNLSVGHFVALIHKDDLEQVAHLLANGMAIAAGYTCHGKNSRRANPYNVQMMQIGNIETDVDDSDEDDEG